MLTRSAKRTFGDPSIFSFFPLTARPILLTHAFGPCSFFDEACDERFPIDVDALVEPLPAEVARCATFA